MLLHRHPQRPPVRAAAVSLLTTLILLLGPAGLAGGSGPEPGKAAGAELRHTELDEAAPAEGALLEEPVDEILLTFTTSVQQPLSEITVLGPDGTPLEAGEVEHPEGRDDQIRIGLARPTEPGTYEVDWRTVAPDGHVASGSYAFTVQEPEEPEPGPPAAPEPPAEPMEEDDENDEAEPDATPAADTDDGAPAGTGTRWLHLLGAVLLLGAAGFRFGILPTLGRDDALAEVRTRLRAGLWRFGWVGALLLLIAAPLALGNQLAQFGEGAGWNEASFILFETAWGGGWFLHLAVVVLAVVGLVLASPKGLGDRGWGILAAAAVLVPLVSALQGHAWGAENLRAVTVPALYLHVAAAGFWLGGLILLVLAGLPAARSARGETAVGEGPPALYRLVNGFSRLALPAVAIFLLTGAVNSWVFVGGISELVGSGYGRTLALKLGFVAGALALGFYNWRRIRPGLRSNPDAGALRIPASIEAVLGIVVLLVTAALVALPMP